MTTPTPGPSSPAPTEGKEEKEKKVAIVEVEEEEGKEGKEGKTRPDNYKIPPKAELKELLSKDSQDESLVKMKKNLIGETPFPDDPRKVIIKHMEVNFVGVSTFPDDPRKVIIKHMEVRIVGEDPIVLDPTKEKQHYNIKEGSIFSLALLFYIQHDIVFNLKCTLSVKRMMMTSTEKYIVGSYGPKKEPQSWQTDPEEAPSGALGRGKYSAVIQLLDDDGQVHLKLPYEFTIVKADK
eukprot:g12895.t1